MIKNHSHSGLGGDGQKIDYNKLKNKPSSSGGSNVKMLTFDRASSVGTGTQSFTGFGFTPTAYHIEAWYDGVSSGVVAQRKSGGYYDGIKTRTWNDTDLTASSRSSTNIIKVNLSGGDITEAQHSALISDGITLNFSESDNNIVLAITCYS